MNPKCISCGEEYSSKRYSLGYKTCLQCGTPRKQFTVAPAFNKGGLQLITNPEDLKTVHKRGNLD